MKSALTLFEIEFDNVPDSTFKQLESQVNESGDLVKSYVKYYDQILLNLFDELEIFLIGRTGKNYVFSNSLYEEHMIPALKRLVNQLVDIYGIDDLDYGKFSALDVESINNDLWTGRMWTEGEEFDHCMINCNFDEGISMTVFTKQR